MDDKRYIKLLEGILGRYIRPIRKVRPHAAADTSKKQNKRYKPKKMKRPRAWHRKGKPVWKIWRELQRDRERLKRVSV